MLKEIDTSLFQEKSTISVYVYSHNIESAKAKVYQLIEGEQIIEVSESRDSLTVTLLKDNRFAYLRAMVYFRTLRGYRSHYAYVNNNISLIGENGFEILQAIEHSVVAWKYTLRLSEGMEKLENQLIMY